MASQRDWRAAGRRLLYVAVGLAVVGGVVAALAQPGDDGSLRTAAGEGSELTEDPTTPTAEQPLDSTSTTNPPRRTSSTVAAATTVTALPPTTRPTTTTPTTATPTAAAATPGPRLQVKFEDGSGVRLRDGRFVSLTGSDLTAVTGVLARYPGTTIERLFSRSEEELAAEKARVEALSGRPQPDLNLYYRLVLPAGADRTLAIADLSRLDVVETAYADPEPAPPPAPSPVP